MKPKRSILYLAYAAVIVIMGSLSVLTVTHVLWPPQRWEYYPLHSTVESVGALAGILLATLLLRRAPGDRGGRLFFVALGFLGMGLFDGLHAVVTPGHGFVLLHSVAVLFGGFFFALVWLPGSDRAVARPRWAPWAVAGAAVLLWIWGMLFRQTLPAMRQDGGFTPAAVAINVVGGALFLAASLRFLLDFRRSGKLEDFLFSCMALLFGLAGITFKYSAPWDETWWFWHLMRFLSYVLVLAFMLSAFYQETAQRRRAEQELRRSNEELQAEIAERIRAHEVIQAQSQAILELSTPVVELQEGVLILPLIGTIDSQRAALIMEGLLGKIVEKNARTVLMDLTGVPVVDTQVANHLLRAAQAARLLGARSVIVGIRPEIAQTLVHLGVDLGSVETCGSLKDFLGREKTAD